MKKYLFLTIFLVSFFFTPKAFANTCVAATGAAGNWTSAAAWTSCGGVAPTAADDAQITSATTSITIDAGAVARSADFATFTGTITQGSTGTLTLGDATAGLSNIALNIPAGATYAPNSASTITFISTSATQQTVLISNTYTAGKLTFNSASNGDYAMTAAITTATASTVLLTDGALHTDGATDNGGFAHSWGLFNYGNAATRTINFGNSSITLKAAGMAITASGTTNITITANTATMTFTGASVTTGFGGKDWNGLSVVYTGGGTMQTSATGGTFKNYTVNGTAVKTDIFMLASTSGVVITGALSFNGNSVTNRLFVRTDGYGTPKTITLSGASASLTGSNVNFRDIAISSTGGAPATPIDLSAISGGSGDRLGNSGITFTTPVDQHWIKAGGAGGLWSGGATNWTTRTPLPQDDVFFDFAFGTSQTVTADMVTGIGNNIDWSGATWTTALTWTATSQPIVTGSVTLKADMTWNTGNLGFSFQNRSPATLTSAGVSLGSGTMFIHSVGSTLTLNDALSITGASTLLDVQMGTFNANGFSVTAPIVSSTVLTAFTRAITMGTGAWTLTGTGAVWSSNATNFTLNSTGSTISMTDVSASAKTFAGGGLTYNNLSITSDGSAGTTTFTGANTWTGSWTIGAGGIKSIVLPGSATTVITASAGLGNGANVITFTASAGSATVSSATGNFCWDYVNLTNIPSAGGATFSAGANSTDGGGNTGWSFTACPGGAARRIIIVE